MPVSAQHDFRSPAKFSTPLLLCGFAFIWANGNKRGYHMHRLGANARPNALLALSVQLVFQGPISRAVQVLVHPDSVEPRREGCTDRECNEHWRDEYFTVCATAIAYLEYFADVAATAHSFRTLTVKDSLSAQLSRMIHALRVLNCRTRKVL